MAEERERERLSTVRLHVFVFALASVLTVVNQAWVGGFTIYDASLIERREQAHQVLLENTPPPGETWSSQGANRTNIRVSTALLAEGLRQLTGQPLHRVYFAIDSAGLLVALLLVYWFLSMGGSKPLALGGLLFVGSLLPLTYHLHFFHPWDRVSLALWAAALIMIRRGAWLWLGLLLPIAVIVKFDIVLVPLLYLAAVATRSNWRRPLGVALGLLFMTFATYWSLRILIPGGFEETHLLARVAKNLSAFFDLGLRYPPLLVFALPACLALIGLRSCDRFERAAFGFALLQAGVLAGMTNFVEVRAEMPVLILMLPAGLKGLERLLGGAGVEARNSATLAA